MTGEITRSRQADENNRVVTVEGANGGYRRRPCGPCPWKVENAGSFPAEAFRISAETAYDASFHMFACHEAGVERTKVCAGFLLQNAANNVGVRIAQATGRIDLTQVENPGNVLFSSYREMAVANGVDPEDPALSPCRGDDE